MQPAQSQLRPFRFGVVAGAPGLDQWKALVRRVEDLGYAALFLSDHLDLGGAHPSTLAPIPALASAAALSSTLTVGTSVLNHDLRHPAVLAREALTIQLLSGGRLELGIGAGWAQVEYDWAGIPFDRAAIRIERLGEYVQVVKALMSEGTVDFAGKYYTISSMPGAFAPIDPPRVMMGGYGRATLTWAARLADIVNINAVGRPDAGPAAMEEKVRLIGEARGEQDAPELSTMVVMAEVSDRPRADALAARLDALRAAGHRAPTGGLTVDQLLESPAFLVGSVEQICEQLVEQRRRWGISYYLISHPDLERFAPVLQHLTARAQPKVGLDKGE